MSLVTIAGQGTLRRDLKVAEGRKEESGEDLTGNCSSEETWKPKSTKKSHPPNPIDSSVLCSIKLAPPRRLSREYNKICTTHKKLVKSGVVKCSVSLSDTPPTILNLPSAPTSPVTIFPQLEGSVHWGAVGDFSGVQTPEDSLAERASVIKLVPPILPPRNRNQLTAPTLLQGVSSILQQLPSSPETISSEEILENTAVHLEETPSVPRIDTVRRRFSSTDPGFLESTSSEFCLPSPSDFQQLPLYNTTMVESENFHRRIKELQISRRSLLREVEDLSVDDVCPSRIPLLEGELADIKKLKNEYQDGVEDLIEEYEGRVDNESVLDKWKKDLVDVKKRVKNHARDIRDRKALFPTGQFPDGDRRSMDALLKLQELTLQEKQKSNAVKSKEKEDDSNVLAESEGNLFFGECSVFGDMMTDENWEEVEDEVISQGVRNLAKWQEQWNQIERSYRKYENMAVRHNFSEINRDAVRTTYEEKREMFEVTRDALVKEDSTVRGLYTLEPTRSDIMKYPTFSGASSEDFLQFKETMELRFRENKVKKKEQVSKLRECLRGAALARVPEGVKVIEEAFRRLSEAFGNPSKVMSFQLISLEDMGMLPADRNSTGQFNFAKKIEWFLKLEVILAKILDLSSRSSKLAHEAFSSSTYRKLWARFPTSVLDKLVKVPGEDAERLRGILNKIVQMREHSQVMDDECGNTTAAAAKKQDPSLRVTVEVFFRTPETHAECRVCVHLSATGQNHPDLFENHLSNYATGCPKFIEASTEFRKTLVSKIKLCKQCFHPDLIVTREHYNECPFNKKKNNYSCQNKYCKEHMWICLTHKGDNKQAMEKFRQELQKKGHNLAMTTDMSLQVNQTNPLKLTQAVKKLKKAEKRKGGEVVPVPEGQPLFLFHATQGKTKPVMTFYDTGCSHAVFKQGIPR